MAITFQNQYTALADKANDLYARVNQATGKSRNLLEAESDALHLSVLQLSKSIPKFLPKEGSFPINMGTLEKRVADIHQLVHETPANESLALVGLKAFSFGAWCGLFSNLAGQLLGSYKGKESDLAEEADFPDGNLPQISSQAGGPGYIIDKYIFGSSSKKDKPAAEIHPAEQPAAAPDSKPQMITTAKKTNAVVKSPGSWINFGLGGIITAFGVCAFPFAPVAAPYLIGTGLSVMAGSVVQQINETFNAPAPGLQNKPYDPSYDPKYPSRHR